MAETLDQLLEQIRACRICAEGLPHEPRPVVRADASAKIVIIGQAPGTRVNASGIPFTDPSGDRLRDWMGVTETEFYDESHIAITPMGFCFPGLDSKGGDLPPRKECAPQWQDRLHAQLPSISLTLLVGAYAQKHKLGARKGVSLTETVRRWRDYAPSIFPLPHPSWRNNRWLKKNEWFEIKLLPELRSRIREILHRNTIEK